MMLAQENEKKNEENRKVFDYICSRHSRHDLKTQQTDNSKVSERITEGEEKRICLKIRSPFFSLVLFETRR
jgi:hypothetical protein